MPALSNRGKLQIWNLQLCLSVEQSNNCSSGLLFKSNRLKAFKKMFNDFLSNLFIPEYLHFLLLLRANWAYEFLSKKGLAILNSLFSQTWIVSYSSLFSLWMIHKLGKMWLDYSEHKMQRFPEFSELLQPGRVPEGLRAQGCLWKEGPREAKEEENQSII